MLRILIALSTVSILLASPALAQPLVDPAKAEEKRIAAARQRLYERIPTAPFHEKLPFAKFLRVFSQQLSKSDPLAVRLDRDAFGKDFERMLKAEVNLPPVPERMVANIALRLAFSQAAPDTEFEYLFRPGEIIVTTRERSMQSITYEIRDLLPSVRQLQLSLNGGEDARRFHGTEPWFDLDTDITRPAEWIARQAIAMTDSRRAGWRDRTPASTIRIQNGTKLVIHTTPSIHAEIESFLHSMRRLVDIAVVMNARVYELDRAEYDQHFASAFVNPKDKSARLVSTVTTAQWKRLATHKPILTGDADKLKLFERSDFFSYKNAYLYKAKPGAADSTIAFEGFSFAVRPVVSPDRRCLRLEFFHEVEQLVKLTKGTMLDLKTNKEVPIELPNLRKSQRAGAIEIQDTQPILLAVDYRAGAKVWLMLAEPRIYMEEEEELIRKGWIKPMPLADERPAPPEPPFVEEKQPPPVQLPASDDVKQILHGIIESVLTDPDLKTTREFYGTPSDKKFSLDNGDRYLWPKDFRVAIAGNVQHQFQADECRSFHRRMRGIRIGHFDWDGKKANVKEVSIEVTISNVGGGVNGSVIGACFVKYSAKREGKRWVVEMLEAFDP